MTLGLLGAMAMAPMSSVRWPSVSEVLNGRALEVAGRWSVSDVQVAPPMVVRHTPPEAAETKMRLGLVGSTATPEMRPLTATPLNWGEGPIWIQCGVWL